MTSTLAASFRALFTTLTALAFLAILAASGLVWYSGLGLVPALGLLIGGLILLIACFGLVAIQIENNELLAVIAEAVTEGQGGSAPATPPTPPNPPTLREAEPLLLRPVAQSAPQPAPPPRMRVEPVVTARRG